MVNVFMKLLSKYLSGELPLVS